MSTTACDDQLSPELVADQRVRLPDGSIARVIEALGNGLYKVAEPDKPAYTTTSGNIYPREDLEPVAQTTHSTLGRKSDSDKPRLDLLIAGMPRALEEVAKVLTYGSQKYADNNWQYVENAEQRYLAAGMRHELAIHRGEALDPETGLHHLAHKLCCDLFRLELLLREEKPND